jgi:uncharacterized PurR-regulated membrane protein YhhQ (DUF165 family)
VGQGIDSLIFYPLAFYGVWDKTRCSVLLTQFALKVGWEVLSLRSPTPSSAG